MKTALTFLKNHWKRMSYSVSSFDGQHFCCNSRFIKTVLTLANKLGDVKSLCVLFMGDFIALDGEGCQCELAHWLYRHIPLDPDFFEISLTEE